MIKKFVQSIISNGGASLDLYNGILNPNNGYSASKEGYELKFQNSDDFGTLYSLVKRYLTDTFHLLLEDTGFILGAWVNGDVLYLDISKHFSDEMECREFAIKNNQVAYFDHDKKQCVYSCEINNPEQRYGWGKKIVVFNEKVANNIAYQLGTYYIRRENSVQIYPERSILSSNEIYKSDY